MGHTSGPPGGRTLLLRPSEVPISPVFRGFPMKSTLQRFGSRATMLLGTFAAFAFVIDSAKRW
jgi:hypothetical protein